MTRLFSSPRAKTVLMANSGGNNLNTAAARYLQLVGMITVAGFAAEAPSQMYAPCAGILRNLYVFLDGAPGAGTSYTFMVRLNGGNTALVVVVSDAETDDNDTANAVTVAAGDAINVIVTPAGPPAARQAKWSVEFDPF